MQYRRNASGQHESEHVCETEQDARRDGGTIALILGVLYEMSVITGPWYNLAAIFAAVFLAELGDKTQVATLLFASDRALSPVLVFLAASAALVVSTGLAVAIGSQGARYLEMVPLKLIAGVGFIAIGGWSILEHFRA